MRKILFTVFLLSAIAGKAQFQIDGVYRLRTEFKDGVKTLSDSTKNPAFVSAQRTRLNVGFTDDKFKFYVSLYDARIWGEEALAADISTIGVHQAYVSYKINSQLNVSLGRQELNYDKKRLIADKNWNNVGAAHDLALLQYKNAKWQAHLAFAYNNDIDKSFESDYPVKLYKYLSFLWFNYKPNDGIDLSVMNLFDGNQKSGAYKTIYTRGTSGFLATLKKGKVSADAATYYQYGKLATGTEVSAYFFHIYPSYQLSEKIELGAGIDYFSGTDAKANSVTNHSFSNLYGSGHAYCGAMDYFTDITKHTKDGGLNDMYLKMKYKLSGKLDFQADLHNFQFTTNVIDSVSNPGQHVWADKQLGTEIDFSLKYKFYKSADLMFGYSAMFPGQSMEILKGGDYTKGQNWLWFAIQFKPQLFKSEEKVSME